MLDASLLAQLKDVFAGLPRALTLAVRPSDHARHGELLELARDVASTSDAIDVKVDGAPSDGVHMALHADGAPIGVSFRGVPGGHEFTSLVVAMLNAAGKGKLPDARTQARVRALAGGKVRTYVSLDCTNCPDVVQALNLIALLHPGIEHEMVDGALVPDEVARLRIQGVPAVFVGEELVHSGRGAFVDLLGALERTLGVAPAGEIASPAPVSEHDVVVIGGGPAGASAAIYSARKGQRVAIVADRIGGQLKETVGIENMIGKTYTEGKLLAADLERHVRAYPIELFEHRRVLSVAPIAGGADANGAKHEIALEGGERLRAGAVIVATGAKWRELEVPGEREYIGRGVAFCPHCDGPYYKGKRVAVVGGGNSGVEAALDLSGIAAHVTLVEYADALKADAVLVSKLGARANIDVVTGARTTVIRGDGAKVTSLELEDRRTAEARSLALDGVFVQVGLVPNSAFLDGVVARNARGEIIVDEKGRTSAPGIYAAGDVTTVPFKQIVIAMGEGAKVALAAFEERALGG